MKNKNNIEKVSITLFSDGTRYRDDLFVAVNGRRYNIARGVNVSVPAFVAEVIEHSQEQDAQTAQYIAGLGAKI